MNHLVKNEYGFCQDGKVYIYYASSDTRMHVAVSDIERLVDYVTQTPEDDFTTYASVQRIIKLIDKNKISQL